MQAVPYQSTYNRGSLSLETYFAQSWGFYFNLSQWYYSIYSGQDYGSRQIISAIVSRRLADRPEIYLSASAVTSWFAYADKYQDSDTRPIHMLDREMVLVASLRFKHWLTDHISLTLATEGRRDIVRALFSWYILSGLGVRIGKWVEADIVYDRSSEARTVLGGTLQSFTANIKVTF